jgi:hypothetical protein
MEPSLDASQLPRNERILAAIKDLKSQKRVNFSKTTKKMEGRANNPSKAVQRPDSVN